MTLYGFIVLAWLLIPDHAPIPFATMEACELAKETRHKASYTSNRYDRAIVCVHTGAPR